MGILTCVCDNVFLRYRIIFRIRQLHIIRWQMLPSHKRQIMRGTPAKSLGLQLPKPEEPPPAVWWNADCDHSLVVGILKHGETWEWSACKKILGSQFKFYMQG